MNNYWYAGTQSTGEQITNSFSNPAARMGVGTRSLAEATTYEMVRWSNNYWLLITLFRNSWLARRIVELPALEMTRKWCHVKGQMIPENIKLVNAAVMRTYTPSRVKQALTCANLFGGAGALIVIKGHENILDQPLNLDDVNPGSYKGLIVFDKWSGITPSLEISYDFDNPLGYGLPEFYEIRSGHIVTNKVHHSRILRFTGPMVPNPESATTNGWGISILEPIYEELRKRDNMSWSILQLVFRAQILAQTNPDLAQLLSGAGSSTMAAQRFQQQMQMQNELLSNNSMLILGKDASLQSHQYSFGGLSDIYGQFQMDICGAAETTVSRLFGRTATGLGASTADDERLHENRIASKQHEQLKPQLDKLYPIICMSALGEVPKDLDIDFPSIRVLSEEEKANLAKAGMEAILLPFKDGVVQYGSKTILREGKQLSERTGIGTNITDEMIAAAPNDDHAEALVMGSGFGDEPAEKDE